MENLTEKDQFSSVEKPEEKKELSINQEKLDYYLEQLKLEQSLPIGFISGLIAALAGAAVWAVVTVSTGYQIGYMAVGVGFLVGLAIKATGKGIDKIFGIMGAVLSLFGCLLGNFLSTVGFFANAEGVGYFETLANINYSFLPEIMVDTFSPMDLLFYGIAIYQGYHFSFRQLTEQELLEQAAEPASVAKVV